MLKSNYTSYGKYSLKDELIILVPARNVLDVMFYLKYNYKNQFHLLANISGVDIFDSDFRFTIIYDLLSQKCNSRVRIKIMCDELTVIPSVSSIYTSAVWWEREIWDMFGIPFLKVSDLRRLLTDYGFESNPLCKDFSLSGFTEVEYFLDAKNVNTVPLSLAQTSRGNVVEAGWISY